MPLYNMCNKSTSGLQLRAAGWSAAVDRRCGACDAPLLGIFVLTTRPAIGHGC